MVTIFSFLLKFMSTEQRSYLSTAIARCVGMKHPYIKNVPCCLPQKPLAWISALASSLRLAGAGTRALLVSGCKGGSTTTSWHTSWSQLAVKFLSSLWRMKVKPPWRQIITWSALNEAPQTQWLGLIPTHTSIVKHLKFLFIVYSNKNPAPEWEEQSAKVKDIWHWACQ